MCSPRILVNRVNNRIKTNTGISLTKPEPITPENIKDKVVSDDELRQKIINGELVDEKLKTTLFPMENQASSCLTYHNNRYYVLLLINRSTYETIKHNKTRTPYLY